MKPERKPAAAAAPRARRRRSPAPSPMSGVYELDRVRIEHALARRSRYKYVSPRLLREDGGWIVVSPNCSRNVDAAGGEIPIAWLEPDGNGRWRLHAHDHAAKAWVCKARGLTLPDALDHLCVDEQREFWV